MSDKQDEVIDAIHVVSEVSLTSYQAISGWVRDLMAIASAQSDWDAEERWDSLLEDVVDCRDVMEGVFRAAQLLRDLAAITDLEASYVFTTLFDVHEWPFDGRISFNDRQTVEAAFYEARGELRMAKEYRAHPAKCWAEWEEGRLTAVGDIRQNDRRLVTPPEPSAVDGIAARIEEIVRRNNRRVEAALWQLACETPAREVTAAVRAVQECRKRGVLTKTRAASFLAALIGPVVNDMCDADRQWRQLACDVSECEAQLDVTKSGVKGRGLKKRQRVLESCRARRAAQLWAYCFRVFGEHELADLMRSRVAELAVAA